MRRVMIVLAIVATSCSGGEADTTAAPTTSTTVAPPTTTTVAPPTTTTSSSTTTTSSSTTTTVPAGFVAFTHPRFTLSHPVDWSDNPEFPGTGAGFLQDHTALALPATTFSIFLEQQEAGFDLDAHIQRVQDDLASFVEDFRVLDSGEQLVDGAPSRWFQYAEDFDGFPIIVREQAALRDDLLVTFSLISPVEFFEYDVGLAAAVVESFRFS